MENDAYKLICLFCGGALNENGVCINCKKKQKPVNNPAHCLKYRTPVGTRYVIVSPVGEGGSGITYSAFNLENGKKVAIKEYFPKHLVERSKTSNEIVMKSIESKDAFQKGQARFISEAKRMMDFKNFGDFPVIESLFSENGTAYIAMEFVEGITLSKFVKNHIIITKKTATEVLRPVFKSIISLHEKGFIHCDISPDNILVSKANEGRLIDFGATKRENFEGVNSSALVKDGYSPPEMYLINVHPTPASDVYSLAATIYYICEKKNLPAAFHTRKINDCLDRIDDSRYGEQFLAVLDKALSENPKARQQSAREFADDLIKALKIKIK